MTLRLVRGDLTRLLPLPLLANLNCLRTFRLQTPHLEVLATWRMLRPPSPLLTTIVHVTLHDINLR